jgi:catechol 2,3-dioxygenase-like lactoylglutathione lyase family enzyme
MRRFYGQGAGFAEESQEANETRFLVGSDQWIEFQQAQDTQGMRRLRYVTLAAPDLQEVESELRDRDVPATRIGPGPGTRGIEVRDPAGDVLRIAEPRPSRRLTSPDAQPFSNHLQHMGFSVRRAQAESTIAFYRDRLGLPEVVRMAGPDGQLALVKFQLPGPRRDLIELIFYDPPLNKWAAGAFDHVNFEVSDINEAYRRLQLGGIATQEKHRPTVNGERLWAINIMDPELTRMEVQVLTPAREAIGTVSAATRAPRGGLPTPTLSR